MLFNAIIACFHILENLKQGFLCGLDLKPIWVHAYDIEDHFDTHIGYLQLLTCPTSGFPFFETICSWAPPRDRIDFIIPPFDSVFDANQSVLYRIVSKKISEITLSAIHQYNFGCFLVLLYQWNSNFLNTENLVSSLYLALGLLLAPLPPYDLERPQKTAHWGG